MTIKKLLLISLCFLMPFVILITIFGENGYLVNKSLEKRYEVLKQKEELYLVKVASLSKQYELLDENSAMDDLALSLGYNREGEKVFYFQEPDVEYSSKETYVDELPPIYHGMSLLIIFIISSAICFVCTIFILILTRNKNIIDESNYEGEVYHGDYDFWLLPRVYW